MREFAVRFVDVDVDPDQRVSESDPYNHDGMIVLLADACVDCGRQEVFIGVSLALSESGGYFQATAETASWCDYCCQLNAERERMLKSTQKIGVVIGRLQHLTSLLAAHNMVDTAAVRDATSVIARDDDDQIYPITGIVSDPDLGAITILLGTPANYEKKGS